jgi:choline dehydrogenase-like flavoprotein
MIEPEAVSPNGAHVVNKRATTFLSRGFESLALRVAANPQEIHFDVIVIGSGYGASVAASHFSACKVPDSETETGQARVCVLERGKERLPGSFPTGFSDLPGELRLNGNTPDTPGGNAQGLFEMRLGTVASAVVANGLGGGSLINAGVMLKPDEKVLNSWPAALGGAAGLLPYYEKAEHALGVLDKGVVNNVETTGRATLHKYRTLEQLAGNEKLSGNNRQHQSEAVPITVALKGEKGIPVITDECIDCGDCAQGCNHNAKKSLDTNLLASAALNGAEIYTGANVLKFDKTDSGWEVFVTHTDPTRSKRTANPVRIRCSKLVVAAGTYASNEIMFRSRFESQYDLKFSEKLGHHFPATVTTSPRSPIVHHRSTSQPMKALHRHSVMSARQLPV